MDGTATADGKHAGKLPISENLRQQRLIPAEGLDFFNRREHETMALIGDARSALGRSGVGILHRDWTAGDQGILAIVEGMREGVRQTEIETAGHAPAQRNCCAVISAGSRAVELIDRAQLSD